MAQISPTQVGHLAIPAKWSKAPNEIRDFHARVNELWARDKFPKSEVESLASNLAYEYKKLNPVTLQSGKAPVIVQKMIIFSASFPRSFRKHNIDLNGHCVKLSYTPSYEMSRALFVELNGQQGHLSHYDQVDRFLKVWPKDPLIKYRVIFDYGDKVAKVKPLSIINQYIGELQRDWPEKDELLLNLYGYGCFAIYNRKLHKQGINDQKALAKGIEYYKETLKHPEASELELFNARHMIKVYEPLLKKP